MNKVLITGRLAKDHKIGQIPGRTAVCGFSVAVNRKFVNKQTGEREADFTNCTIWRKNSRNQAKYDGLCNMHKELSFCHATKSFKRTKI